jgi:hypothetical protein
MIKILSLIILLSTSLSFGMAESKASEVQSKSADASMTQIKKWEDVAQFAGKIVAYKATSYYLARSSKDRCSIATDPSFVYGYVKGEPCQWDGIGLIRGEMGYDVARLFRPEAVASACAFIDTRIKEDSVQMRLVTAEERSKIAEALKLKKAKFEYGFFFEKQVNDILSQ